MVSVISSNLNIVFYEMTICSTNKIDPHIFLHCHKCQTVLVSLILMCYQDCMPDTKLQSWKSSSSFVFMCIKLLKILASILLLTDFFLNFVKVSHLLYQYYAQIWTILLAWYIVSHFTTCFLFTNMSSMASTLAFWFSTFQWSEIYKFTLILIRRSHENRHAPK